MTSTASAHPTLRFADLRGNGEYKTLFDAPGLYFTYNGRGAIYQFLRWLPESYGDTVLLPAFHCPTVVDPALHAGYQVRFFAINENLDIDHEDLLNKLDTRVAAVLIINYFGFPAKLGPLPDACRDAGAILIEDCAHSFLRTDPCRLGGERGDVAVFSFKKLVPSEVGGGLRINREGLEFRPINGAIPWRESLRTDKHLFEQAIENLDGGLFKRLYCSIEGARVAYKNRRRSTEDLTPERELAFEYPFEEPLARARMGRISRRILTAASFTEIARARRENYKAVLHTLRLTSRIRPVFDTLPDTVCPWAFPVILNGRSQIDFSLREAGVPLFTFGETPHLALRGEKELGQATSRTVRHLRGNLLCLALHQRLSAEYVAAYCHTINAYLRHSLRDHNSL